MKLRIQGDSLRFRLTQPEVENLSELRRITSEINFPNGSKLSYTLKTADEFHCSFDDNQIVVTIPTDDINTWAESDQVGISQDIELQNKLILLILVEKDFKCLTRSSDEERDMYPNPKTSHL